MKYVFKYVVIAIVVYNINLFSSSIQSISKQNMQTDAGNSKQTVGNDSVFSKIKRTLLGGLPQDQGNQDQNNNGNSMSNVSNNTSQGYNNQYEFSNNMPKKKGIMDHVNDFLDTIKKHVRGVKDNIRGVKDNIKSVLGMNSAHNQKNNAFADQSFRDSSASNTYNYPSVEGADIPAQQGSIIPEKPVTSSMTEEEHELNKRKMQALKASQGYATYDHDRDINEPLSDKSMQELNDFKKRVSKMTSQGSLNSEMRNPYPMQSQQASQVSSASDYKTVEQQLQSSDVDPDTKSFLHKLNELKKSPVASNALQGSGEQQNEQAALQNVQSPLSESQNSVIPKATEGTSNMTTEERGLNKRKMQALKASQGYTTDDVAQNINEPLSDNMQELNDFKERVSKMSSQGSSNSEMREPYSIVIRKNDSANNMGMGQSTYEIPKGESVYETKSNRSDEIFQPAFQKNIFASNNKSIQQLKERLGQLKEQQRRLQETQKNQNDEQYSDDSFNFEEKY